MSRDNYVIKSPKNSAHSLFIIELIFERNFIIVCAKCFRILALLKIVDPVVASLTPSQKRRITELYGGGAGEPPQTGDSTPSHDRADKTRDE